MIADFIAAASSNVAVVAPSRDENPVDRALREWRRRGSPRWRPFPNVDPIGLDEIIARERRRRDDDVAAIAWATLRGDERGDLRREGGAA